MHFGLPRDLSGGGGVQECNHSPDLLSCQANVRMRLRSFVHYVTRVLGAAPEMCWGLGQLHVITFPPVDDSQKNNRNLIFNLIKTETKPNLLYFWVSQFLLHCKAPLNLSGWGQQAFLFLAHVSAGQPCSGLARLTWLTELIWTPGLGSNAGLLHLAFISGPI